LQYLSQLIRRLLAVTPQIGDFYLNVQLSVFIRTAFHAKILLWHWQAAGDPA
jgi:hypothetical protein